MIGFFRRHHRDPVDPTPAQRDRMLMMAVAGESDGPGLMQAGCRLMFGRDLVEHGRIGENDQPTESMIARAIRIAGERAR